MNLTENIRLAFGSLMANKLRAILTMLGIIIGVAAVITLVSVGEGVQAVVVSEFEGLGNNLLFVTPGQPEAGGFAPSRRRAEPTNHDYLALALSLHHIRPSRPAITGTSRGGPDP